MLLITRREAVLDNCGDIPGSTEDEAVTRFVKTGRNTMNKQSKSLQKLWMLTLVMLLQTLVACVPPAVEPTITAVATQSTAELANPASLYCLEQGGNLAIEERGNGGQFGVCYFEDKRQCEEWALLRGDCPVGGLKVTGYITEAVRYCAITGGVYTNTGSSGAEDEQGTCTFNDGTQCDVSDYYNGQCVPGTSTLAAESQTNSDAGAAIQPLVVEVCNGQAQAMAHVLDVLEVTQSEAPLSDPVNGTSGTGCLATVTGTGKQFESPQAAVDILGSMLEEQGWTKDPLLAAGGPTGVVEGYRKDDQICFASAMWEPDESANCPDDQPISACEVTPEQQLFTITLNCGIEGPHG
jgi:putative hemolysin